MPTPPGVPGHSNDPQAEGSEGKSTAGTSRGAGIFWLGLTEVYLAEYGEPGRAAGWYGGCAMARA